MINNQAARRIPPISIIPGVMKGAVEVFLRSSKVPELL
jgi:hypothetical protein